MKRLIESFPLVIEHFLRFKRSFLWDTGINTSFSLQKILFFFSGETNLGLFSLMECNECSTYLWRQLKLWMNINNQQKQTTMTWKSTKVKTGWTPLLTVNIGHINSWHENLTWEILMVCLLVYCLRLCYFLKNEWLTVNKSWMEDPTVNNSFLFHLRFNFIIILTSYNYTVNK